MPGLRRSPPHLGHGVLLRPRLLAELLHRFDTRVVCVTAPAGFGKTTLLAQAVHENGLVGRGHDVWLTCLPGDAVASQLLDGLAHAFDRPTTSSLDVSTITEAVLSRAPVPVALILDDVHEIARGSDGAALLDELISQLPANGHVVLAGRTEPPVRMARLLTTGDAIVLGEEDLRLAPDELASLAQLRGLADDALLESGGWPALASLSASAPPGVAERYVWEEVLGQLSVSEQRALAALALLDGGDLPLVAGAIAAPVDGRALSQVPLVERREDGSLRPHPLWRPALADVLGDDEIGEVRRRAAAILRSRGDLRERRNCSFLPTTTSTGPRCRRSSSPVASSLNG